MEASANTAICDKHRKKCCLRFGRLLYWKWYLWLPKAISLHWWMVSLVPDSWETITPTNDWDQRIVAFHIRSARDMCIIFRTQKCWLVHYLLSFTNIHIHQFYLPLVPHICVSESGQGPIRRQAIILTSTDLLSIEPLGTNLDEIRIDI